MSTLNDFRPGQGGTISRLEGDDPTAIRLLEMGLLPGRRIEVLGAAPLGDPIAVRISGTRVAIRRVDARRIHVQAEGEAPPAGVKVPETTTEGAAAS